MRAAIRRIGFAVVLGGIAYGSASPSAKASTLFSNLSQPVDASTSNASVFWNASAFTTDSHSYSLSDIVVPIHVDSGPTNFTLDIRSDASGSPGAVLDTLTATTPIPSSFGNVVFTPDNPLTLQPGTTYWVSADVSQGIVDWQFTKSLGSTGPASLATNNYADSQDLGTTWNIFPNDPTDNVPVMFQVDANSIIQTPEPSGWIVASAMTLIGAVSLRRRGRKSAAA